MLLLDEPDNFLDVPAKLELEQRIRSSKKTIVMISHDRAVLAAALGAIVTLEGNGAWVHGESYATYAQAREDRQRRLGDAVKRWHEEERRLFRLMKTFKERARYAADWAKRADAMESRWNRFRAPGPPPSPVADQAIAVRIRGSDSARIVLDMRALGASPATRLGVLRRDPLRRARGGHRPNGRARRHSCRARGGARPDAGELRVGPRVSTGFFTQLQSRGGLRRSGRCSTS